MPLKIKINLIDKRKSMKIDVRRKGANPTGKGIKRDCKIPRVQASMSDYIHARLEVMVAEVLLTGELIAVRLWKII